MPLGAIEYHRGQFFFLAIVFVIRFVETATFSRRTKTMMMMDYRFGQQFVAMALMTAPNVCDSMIHFAHRAHRSRHFVLCVVGPLIERAFV